jgi:cytochrome P450
MPEETEVRPPDFPMPRAKACPLNPSPEYHRLREEAPISKVTVVGGHPAWLITRFDDARQVLGDDRFSADPTKPGYPSYPLASDEIGKRWLTRMDPPEHDVLRRMVSPEFSVRRMEAIRPAIQKIVDGLIDDITVGPKPAELVSAFCMQVPGIVICEQLGVPHKDHDFFHETVVSCFKTVQTDEELQAARAANVRFIQYLDDLIREKEAQPADDLLSRLAEEQIKPGHLSHTELVDLARLMVLAGFDTTGNTLGLGILLLLDHADQLAALQADPGLWPGAVEEILRFTTITQAGRRRAATEDIEVGGFLIRAGEGVLVAQDAANRDPSAFPDPDAFDIYRKARHHLAFGYGSHACVGGPLARLELHLGLETLFRRLPNLALAVPFDELPFAHDNQAYGVYRLPVAW